MLEKNLAARVCIPLSLDIFDIYIMGVDHPIPQEGLETLNLAVSKFPNWY